MNNKCGEDIEERFVFFDIFDNCIGYKFNGEKIKFYPNKEAKDVVDKSVFLLPICYCPLGKSCEEIWKEYRKHI